MPFPVITGLYTALSILLVLGLAVQVSRARRATRTGLGSGTSGLLERRIRAHGNAVEHLPLALIGLGLLELTGHAPLWLHILGGVLLASRVLHAWGLWRSAGATPGRLLGTLGTWGPMLVIALMLLGAFLR